MKKQSNDPIHDLRKTAFNHLLEKGFPTKREEEWRFTDISPIIQESFILAEENNIKEFKQSDIIQLMFKDWAGPLLVFINGNYAEHLSDINTAQAGLTIDTMLSLLKKDQKSLLDTFTEFKTYNENVFSALNTAFIKDGSIIKLEKNVIADKPIHLLYISTKQEKPQLINPRNLIYLSDNSQAVIIESHVNLTDGQYFNNPVTEIRIAENARCNHIRIQDESSEAFHIGSIFVDQKQNSHYFSTSLMFGGKIARNNIYTNLDGEGIETILNGLYMGHDDQLIDNHTFINHAKPHCESHELYQGILTDNAKGVFSGKIMVRPDAQKTDAKQSNNCLLLSNEARINSKPQLEIYADDVRCTHGATVGQLNQDAIFYLRSRGITWQRAKNILTYAFAEQVVEGIGIDSVRDYVNDIILSRLKEDMNFIK
ncbi:MAG: Fe-S cluster assembly protein SufD [Calditrichaceae bacterium]|nr:Fe-S cluster assembly protein SufD [Calditrichaceae bacterium]